MTSPTFIRLTRVSEHRSAMIIQHGESMFAELLVYGTPGWGKSYMIAAAAVVL